MGILPVQVNNGACIEVFSPIVEELPRSANLYRSKETISYPDRQPHLGTLAGLYKAW